MKKLISLLLALILTVCAASCAEDIAQMPNPIYTVTDDDEFERILGIDIDADDIADDAQMSIIAGQMGQICFTLENVNGEDVPWTLRFTKDASFDKSMEMFAGIHDEDVTAFDAIDVEIVEDGKVYPISLTQMTANTLGADVIFWNCGNVFYCLTIEGVYSQMQYAAVMDRIFDAIIDD